MKAANAKLTAFPERARCDGAAGSDLARPVPSSRGRLLWWREAEAVAKEDFAGAMTAMAKLRPAVDAFFEGVKVNDDNADVRANRLKLLNQIRAATRAVADFSKIQD